MLGVVLTFDAFCCVAEKKNELRSNAQMENNLFMIWVLNQNYGKNVDDKNNKY